MKAREWAIEMALYNKWQNGTLYALAGAMSDAELHADRGMFFTSVHNTLDHILMVDERLLDFALSGRPPGLFEPDKVVHGQFSDLRAAREAFDDGLPAILDGQTADWYVEPIDFVSARLDRTRTVPRCFLLMQMFNHATHHRAQVTAELHKLGTDYGITDLPFNPLSQY